MKKSKINVFMFFCLALSYLTCYLANGGFLVFNLPNPTLKSNLSLISSSTTLREKELL